MPTQRPDAPRRRSVARWVGRLAFALVAAALAGALAARLDLPLVDRARAVVAPDEELLRLAAAPARAEAAAAISSLQARLRERPEDAHGWTLLGEAHLQHARDTGDPADYGRAQTAFERALALDPADTEAMAGLGALALARHEFALGLDWARQARAAGDANARTLGVAVDALVELGRYDEAAAALQTMVDLRPDVAALARVAYLRELHGDLDGAVEAMTRAVAGGAPNAEGTAWTTVQLGHLYYLKGNLAAAELHYAAALRRFPGYVHAAAGLGRVRAAQGYLDGAARFYGLAVERLPLPEFAIALGETRLAAGQPEAAARQFALVRTVGRLQAAAGVRTDLDLAAFYADHGDAAERTAAAERALTEYQTRPSVTAAGAAAWALHRAGRTAEAVPLARAAVRLGTPDPMLRFRAGAVLLAAGETASGRELLELALRDNPRFAPLWADEARRLLAEAGAVP